MKIDRVPLSIMALQQYGPKASVSSRKTSLQFSILRTRADNNASFSSSNAICWCSVHTNGASFFFNSWSMHVIRKAIDEFLPEINCSKKRLYIPKFLENGPIGDCSYFGQVHCNLALSDNSPQVLNGSLLKLALHWLA
jgi:hypothetical protein